MLNEGTLVLEGVTLAQVVELVVKVLVDLAGGAVLDQQTTEDTETAHPHNLAVGIVSHNSTFLPTYPLLAILLPYPPEFPPSSSFHPLQGR